MDSRHTHDDLSYYPCRSNHRPELRRDNSRVPFPGGLPIFWPREQERPIRKLFELITDGKSPEKVKVLSMELARLLAIQGPLRKPGDKQLRIVELVAQGRTNRQIAESRGISSNAVRNYLSCIYDRVGVNNRLQLTLGYEARVREGLV